MQEYSLHKLVHYPEVIGMMKEGVQPPPLQIHLIMTNRCNQDCAICAYRRQGYQSNQNFNPENQLSSRQIEEFLADFAMVGGRAVQFTGGGEPLLHPDAPDMIRLARDLSLKTALVTNGLLLGQRARAALWDASWVRVSLDSATPETYARVKNTDPKIFYLVVDNIRKLVASNTDTIIGIGFVVQEGNWHEVYEAAELARDLGVNNIRISAAFTPRGASYFDGFVDQAKAAARRAECLATDSFRVFNLFDERVDQLFSGTQRYAYCHSKDLVPYVGADGIVYSCCVKAYTDAGAMGSIRDGGFRNFWQSEAKRKKYAGHDPRTMCPHPCMFEKKNQFFNYCALANPRHVEFV